MIIKKSVTLSIFGFVLALIFLISIQQALALSVNIERATAGVQSISPGGNISLTSGLSIPVTFTYNGSRPDTQNSIGQFSCSWDREPYTAANCPTPAETKRTIGSTTVYTSSGTTTRNLAPGDHSFSVQVVSSATNNPRIRTADFGNFTITPPPAQLSLRFTGASSSGVPFSEGGSVDSQGRGTVPIRFTYEGINGAINPSPIEFRCMWLPSYGSHTGGLFATNTCPGMTVVSPTMIMGAAERNMGPGSHVFILQVVNSQGRWEERSYPFTISTLDTSGSPIAEVYKANSYNLYATMYAPAIGINNQYHTKNGQVTPYDNMYIAFEAIYPIATGDRSDLFEMGVGTYFQCRWDNMGSLEPCGRFNLVGQVSPGYHIVQFRAINPNGQSANTEGDLNFFYWCVKPRTSNSLSDPCHDFSTHPPEFRPITPREVRSYTSAAPEVSFYPGKNETKPLRDLKEFPILNLTTDAKNQNISLKDLKEFALLYSTISAQDTFLNKKNSTNNFDVTNLGPSQLNKIEK